MLILDLDDTIFETKSIAPESVKSITEVFTHYLEPILGRTQAEAAMTMLWHRPFSVVMDRFGIRTEAQFELAQLIHKLDFELEIETYPDYAELLQLPFPRVLVTTGFTNLQMAKIRALNIANDFAAIFIDDPTEKNRRHKQGIFTGLLQDYEVPAQAFWVIGDNPDSEIKAGHNLKMRTVQRLKAGEPKAAIAEYGIHSFAELPAILNGAS